MISNALMILRKNAYGILIIDDSRSWKKKSNLISHKQDIDHICLYAKDLYWNKYQLLINKRENTDLKHLNYCNRFIVNSNGMDDIHKNIEEYNPNKKRKILTVFDDIIVYMLSDRNLNSIVTGFI